MRASYRSWVIFSCACALLFLLVSYSVPTVRADDSDQATSTPDVASSSPSVSVPVPPTSPTPPPSPVTISLEVDTQTSTLFAGTLTVSACPDTQSGDTQTVNAKCAIEQSGLAADWTWWGSSAFLNAIGGVGNGYVQNTYWGWFSNLSYGATALNEHTLAPGEHLLVTIGREPMRLVAASTSPMVGATTTLQVLQFAFDADFNPLWVPAASSSVYGADEMTVTDANGEALFVPSGTSTLSLYATKEGFLPTDAVLVSPWQVVEEVAPLAVSVPVSPSASVSASVPVAASSGSGTLFVPAALQMDSAKAVAYLLRNQHADGSFDSAMLTDWSAIALAASKAHASDVASFLRTAPLPASASVTDYERRAMALEALGIDPYRGTPTDVIAPIVAALHSTYFGDKDLVNDDLFAILPLMKAGYSAGDTEIGMIVGFVLRAQQADGSWEHSVDLTAAAIQSLALVRDLPGTDTALANAVRYLTAAQRPDGSFGNVFSTSWAMQAFAALGRPVPSAADAGGGNSTPQQYLATVQQADGGIGAASLATSSRVWATAYALPATQHLSWGDVLQSFPRPLGSVSAAATVGTSTAVLVPAFAFSTATTSDEFAMDRGAATSTTSVSESVFDAPAVTSSLSVRSTPVRFRSTTISVPAPAAKGIHRAVRAPKVSVGATPEVSRASVSSATSAPTLLGKVKTFFSDLWATVRRGNPDPLPNPLPFMERGQTIHAAITIDGVTASTSVSLPEGSSVLDALKMLDASDSRIKLGVRTYPGLGVLIERLGEQRNGAGGNYWQYSVNGVMPQVGAGSQLLKDGDTVRWFFAPSTY